MSTNNKKLFGKINFFDLIIVLIVIIIAIVALGIYFSKEKKTANAGIKMTYVLELIDNPIGFSDLIPIGDKISDKIKKFPMGTVVGVEKVPNTKLLNDLINNRVVEVETPDKERVLLTVEADVVDNGKDLLVENSYDIKVGKNVIVKGNGYAGIGYILEVKRD